MLCWCSSTSTCSPCSISTCSQALHCSHVHLVLPLSHVHPLLPRAPRCSHQYVNRFSVLALALLLTIARWWHFTCCWC
jgi:hypothetical protein